MAEQVSSKETLNNKDADIIDAASEWVDDADHAEKGSKNWFSRSIVVSSSGASRRINELEQQVKTLSKRPNVFELDDAEITAIAGEDAATLIRAAKSKAHAVLAEAERMAQGIREQSSAQLAASKEENRRLIDESEKFATDIKIRAEKEADATDKEAQRVLSAANVEANKILENATAEEMRITSDASKRAEELIARTRTASAQFCGFLFQS